jgi:hypothetical protein
MTRILRESLERGDLKRLIHDELHIDEFKSKLGNDEDVVVISFKVAGKEPANDIVSFVEKGYEWVIDADVSSGEMDDGDYIVFVEIPREPGCAKNIMDMMSDIMNLTDQELEDWRVRYYKNKEDHNLDLETLKKLVPETSDEYNNKFGKKEIDSLKTAAGLKVDTKAPKNDFTQSLRAAAGII